MDDDMSGGVDEMPGGDDGGGKESDVSSAHVAVGGSKGETSSHMMTEIVEKELNKGLGKGNFVLLLCRAELFSSFAIHPHPLWQGANASGTHKPRRGAKF